MLSAEEEIRRRIRAYKAVSVGPVTQSHKNRIVALVTMEEESGRFGDVSLYELDQPHRDVLLAYGRQDTAHALLNTISLMGSMLTVRALLVANLVGVAFLIFR